MDYPRYRQEGLTITYAHKARSCTLKDQQTNFGILLGSRLAA